MPENGAEIAAGQQVLYRGLKWDVMGIEALGTQQRIRLRCRGGDLHGMDWPALYPTEVVELERREFRPDRPGDLNT